MSSLSMKCNNYLNVGCGLKYHPGWVNVDMHSTSPHVISHNLLKGIPFPDNRFAVVYHSQVLEHFPKDKAEGFLSECYRVLAPGGIIRIVVPDLENIAREYLRLLDENLENPGPVSAANYEWIMLELYDQTVRDRWQGNMGPYLKQKEMINEEYVLNRTGPGGLNLRNQVRETGENNSIQSKKSAIRKFAGKLKRQILKIKTNGLVSREALLKSFLTKREFEFLQLGKFRLNGEIHYWMYDRYSLKTLLEKTGFSSVRLKTPFESDIPDWGMYELDVLKNGMVIDPGSLFMEAGK